MERKSSKEYSIVFWWKARSSGYEICLRLHLCQGVVLRTRSAHRLNLQHFAAVLTPNIAELVPRDFSIHNHGFCDGPNTFSQKNTRVFISIELRSIKNSRMSNTVFSRLNAGPRINAGFKKTPGIRGQV